MRPLRIATRGSALALWQAEHVRGRLRAADCAAELVVVKTTGDRVQDVPLASIGDRGLFTREIDDALRDGRADLAVHSLKDLPTTLDDGLHLAAVLEREDPADVLIARDEGRTLGSLPQGARVGTSSLRRRAQLRRARPDLEIVDLRGNVDTRLRRVADGTVDATVLARAGLLRLGLEPEHAEVLAAPAWLPAVGQGALAIVAAGPVPDAVAALEDVTTRAAVTAERAFLRRLEGGCQVPIGALATHADEGVEIVGGVFSLDGSARLVERNRDRDPEAAGLALAERLIERGAAAILAEIRGSGTTPAVPAP